MRHVSKLFNVVKVSASTAFLLVGLVGTPVANAADSITFNMSWLPQGSMSGVITAIEKGFYSEVGLDVEAVRAMVEAGPRMRSIKVYSNLGTVIR